MFSHQPIPVHGPRRRTRPTMKTAAPVLPRVSDTAGTFGADQLEADRGLLCETCRPIDFDGLVREKRRERHVLVTTTASEIENGVEKGCPCCELVRAILPLSTPKTKSLSICSPDFTTRFSLFNWVNREALALVLWDNELGTLIPTGFIHEASRSKMESLPVDSVVRDFASLSAKTEAPGNGKSSIGYVPAHIKECVGSHSRCRVHQASSRATLLSEIDLRLIDCERMEVVGAFEAEPEILRYCALSYVRGITPERIAWEFEPASVPAVVSDAITVATRLGYRYLWVDLYCLPTDHPSERLKQVSCMDAVFGAADLTIVAAGSSNITSGLPGIGDLGLISSIPTQTSILGKKFVSEALDPWAQARDGVWGSRAWTFQEERLSTRLLYFTAHQSHFRCRHGEFYVLEDGQRLHRSKCQTAYTHAHGIPDLDDPRENESLFSGLDNLISLYSRRDITRDEEVLKAFSGILRRAEMDAGVFHLMGCPIPFRPRTPQFATAPLYGLSLLPTALAWRHKSEATTATRRGEFPSWTWAGWKGGPIEYFSRWGMVEPVGLSVELELRDGSMLGWDGFLGQLERRIRERIGEDADRTESLFDPMAYTGGLSGAMMLNAWSTKIKLSENKQYHALRSPARLIGNWDSSADRSGPTESKYLKASSARSLVKSIKTMSSGSSSHNCADANEARVYPSGPRSRLEGVVFDALMLGQTETDIILLIVDPAKCERVGLGLIERARASFSEEKGSVETKIDARSWVLKGKIWSKQDARLE